MKKDENKKIFEEDHSKLFYGLSILLLIFMLFSGITSYQEVASYCSDYGLNVGDQWFLVLRTVSATMIPCIVYASLLYGMGLLMKKNKR